MNNEQMARIVGMTNEDLWKRMIETSIANPAPGSGGSAFLGALEGELEKRLRRLGFLPPLPLPEEA